MLAIIIHEQRSLFVKNGLAYCSKVERFMTKKEKEGSGAKTINQL
jgi:hypothetical protein